MTFNQRWADYLTLVAGVLMLTGGVIFRDRLLNAQFFYQDVVSGVSAFYPAQWLLDTDGDYIFRVRDTQTKGFKTTMQVSSLPASDETTARTIADRIALSRAQTLTDFRILSTTNTTFRDTEAQLILYTFVSRELNPFLEDIPSVVLAQDIIVRQRNRAFVLTFRAEASRYEALYPLFSRFLASLEF